MQSLDLNQPVARVLSTGLGISYQDQGRTGWRRYGVPASGAMDPHACHWANRLVDNPENTTILEWVLQGAEIEILQDCWLALTGADSSSNLPDWQGHHVQSGTRLRFPHNRSGVYGYLALAGGWKAESYLNSVSANPRAGLGHNLEKGDLLYAATSGSVPEFISSRSLASAEQPDYLNPAPLEVYPAPQSKYFGTSVCMTLADTTWTVSARSDRTGYRLDGPSFARQMEAIPNIKSEPVLPGSIQIPGDGFPIITMPDGPTVGGYAKIGILSQSDLARLAQCRPGTRVRFKWHSST